MGGEIACKVAAINLSPLDTHLYPAEVAWELAQNNQAEYQALAQTFNQDPLIRGIIIQHEYGIYGGVDGQFLLDFMQACQKPMVLTLHTVLPNPTPNMHSVTQALIRLAQNVVVLTHSSQLILEKLYPDSGGKTEIIPHGIHPTPFTTTTTAKKKLEIKATTVLTTFGLLSRGKGIEYVIKSLPAVIKKHPDLIYLVLGETHPVIRRQEGESYRQELAELVTSLHLEKQVKFYDQYLSLSDLLDFLKATDIYISTSINPNQAVSGTLSYALGTGRAVISTEFAQAKEIITPHTGRLVPIKNHRAFSTALNQLLASPAELSAMHQQAYHSTRPMLWSNVASTYVQLLIRTIPPPLNMLHLRAMTDHIGLFQFAQLTEPNKAFGYTLDDNARALIVCSWLSSSQPDLLPLTETYLRFIERCQLADGSFSNYIAHDSLAFTHQNQAEDLEDSLARAIWALSEVIVNTTLPPTFRTRALALFTRALPHTKHLHHLRSTALIIKAFCLIGLARPEYRAELTADVTQKTEWLLEHLQTHATEAWYWFDTYLSYNNGILPEALVLAGQLTGNQSFLDQGLRSMRFLIETTIAGTMYQPIGHQRWYHQGAERSWYDQQPEEPTATILALVSLYQITHDEEYKRLAMVCFSWFLGNNSLHQQLYSFQNGGCYDGLHPDRVNLNQGAESQVSYLLSRLAVSALYPHENSRNQINFP